MHMTPEQLKHYIEMIKKFEKERTSTNERQAYWRQYFKRAIKGRAETSFDMNQF